MINANFQFGTLIEVFDYRVFSLIYVCGSLFMSVVHYLNNKQNWCQ